MGLEQVPVAIAGVLVWVLSKCPGFWDPQWNDMLMFSLELVLKKYDCSMNCPWTWIAAGKAQLRTK